MSLGARIPWEKAAAVAKGLSDELAPVVVRTRARRRKVRAEHRRFDIGVVIVREEKGVAT